MCSNNSKENEDFGLIRSAITKEFCHISEMKTILTASVYIVATSRLGEDILFCVTQS
jgi:hypothetical protein